jgi:hypothetical protein
LADLTAGTYCVSATRLLGVYDPTIREAVWELPEIRRRYEALYMAASQPPSPEMSPTDLQSREQVKRTFDAISRARLIVSLRHRPPDDRIGWSILIYRLTQPEIDKMIAP